jgi:hypothetical protein
VDGLGYSVNASRSSTAAASFVHDSFVHASDLIAAASGIVVAPGFSAVVDAWRAFFLDNLFPSPVCVSVKVYAALAGFIVELAHVCFLFVKVLAAGAEIFIVPA